jgi:hypothetical protein
MNAVTPFGVPPSREDLAAGLMRVVTGMDTMTDFMQKQGLPEPEALALLDDQALVAQAENRAVEAVEGGTVVQVTAMRALTSAVKQLAEQIEGGGMTVGALRNAIETLYRVSGLQQRQAQAQPTSHATLIIDFGDQGRNLVIQGRGPDVKADSGTAVEGDFRVFPDCEGSSDE